MYNYINITKNTQVVVSKGQRIPVKPGDTISLDRELDLKIYDFLQKVEDIKTVSQPSSVNSDLEKRVAELEKNLTICLKRLEILKNAIQTISDNK